MSFFSLQSPRDMLDKAEREYIRLQTSLDVDNVLNFFVTIYHISDYILKTHTVKQSELDSFLSDPDIKASRDLCDKGKHMKLTKRPDPTTRILNGTFGSAPFNMLPFNAGDTWFLFSDGKHINIELLARDVLIKWREFFSRNNL